MQIFSNLSMLLATVMTFALSMASTVQTAHLHRRSPESQACFDSVKAVVVQNSVVQNSVDKISTSIFLIPSNALNDGMKLSQLMDTSMSVCSRICTHISTDEVKLYTPTLDDIPTQVEAALASIIGKKSYFSQFGVLGSTTMSALLRTLEGQADSLTYALFNIAPDASYKAKGQSNEQRISAAFKKAETVFNPTASPVLSGAGFQ